MPAPRIRVEGIVLTRESDTERFHQFSMFNPTEGQLRCLQRRSSRPHNQTHVDLFDHVTCQIERRSSDGPGFVGEIRISDRASFLGNDYPTLKAAATFARLLSLNLIHMESFVAAYELLERAISGWRNASHPEAVLFKAIYLLTRIEGYPVKEAWWNALNGEDRESARLILNRPIESQQTDHTTVSLLNERLLAWVARETDFIL